MKTPIGGGRPIVGSRLINALKMGLTPIPPTKMAISSKGEHDPYKVNVAGSNPVSPN